MLRLSLGNVSKYAFSTGKDVLPEKHFLQRAATTKTIWIFVFGKKLKAQTDTEKKQYQKVDDTCEFDKIIGKN